MPLLTSKSNLANINKTGFSDDKGSTGGSLEVLGESRAVVTNPVKSSPTRRDNREQNRDSRDIQRQDFESSIEKQAISVAANRTRAREKEVAQLRQSQNTPLINIFNENPLGFIINQGQDFFQNTNAKGFIEFKQPKETDFIQDNKLIDNDTTFKQSQPQQFLDIRGNKAIEFTQTNRVPSIEDDSNPSRLLSRHNKDNQLNKYYSQLKTSGQLGIRRQSGPVSFSLLKQPFIVRDIGNNWGVDTVNPDELGFFGAVGGIVRGGINIIDQLGGAVIGRQPSVFASRALADVGRLGSLLLSTKGIGFLEKQRVLKRQNSYLTEKDQKDFPNSKYLGSVRGPISGFYSSDLEGSTSNLIDIGTNLKKYNQLSLLSQPGIPSLQFSINKGPDAFQLGQYAAGINSLAGDLGINLSSIPNNVRDVFPPKLDQRKYNVTIDSNLNLPNFDLLDAISPVASVVSSVVTTGVNFLKGLRGPSIGLNLTSPFKTPSLPSIPNPFKGFETGGGTGGVFGNPFQKLGGITSGIGNFVRGIGNAVSSIGSINLDKNPINSSKSKAYEFDAEAWAEVGRDKVNLIPYGKRTGNAENGYAGVALTKDNKTENEIDFIPFRFEDSEGNLIVFRAILSGITDTFTPEYSSERYVGRPDNVYVYQGTTREISFTVDIYPKSADELPVLYKKMNYLAGLTYPEWASANGGGLGMVAPFCKLTLGEMYTNTSGYISGLTYTVMDSSTWETVFAKLPKYIQASVSFVYIGDRLPSKDQKHYEAPWIPEVQYGNDGGTPEDLSTNKKNGKFASLLSGRKKVSLASLTGQTSSTSAQNSINEARSQNKKTFYKKVGVGG